MRTHFLCAFCALALSICMLLCACDVQTQNKTAVTVSDAETDTDGTDGKMTGYEYDDFMDVPQTAAVEQTATETEATAQIEIASASPKQTAASTQTPKQTTKPVQTAAPVQTPTPTAAPVQTPTPTATPAQTAEAETVITLNGTSADIKGPGAAQSGSVIAINAAGTYRLKGAYTGQITVSVDKSERVYMIFDGVNIDCTQSAPVWVQSADKVVITLEKGTENKLTDSAKYLNLNAQGEPCACLFSKDDLTIKGEGSLNIVGNYNNGIMSKDDLKITGGNITINAVKNGLRGNDSVSVAGGDITVTAKKDGIKTTNETDADKGFILIEGGTLYLGCGDDGLQATRSVTVKNCTIKMHVSGDRVNCDGKVDIQDGCIV